MSADFICSSRTAQTFRWALVTACLVAIGACGINTTPAASCGALSDYFVACNQVSGARADQQTAYCADNFKDASPACLNRFAEMVSCLSDRGCNVKAECAQEWTDYNYACPPTF